MSATKIIRFNEALDNAIKLLQAYWPEFGEQVILVRDLYGRIRVVLENDPETEQIKQAHSAFAREFQTKLGAFGPQDQVILYGNQLYDRDAVYNSPDRRLLIQDQQKCLFLIDRQLIGQDWNRLPLTRQLQIRRITFFGLKGGVGRSTALAVWAWHLARVGKKVLVFDLDLESPGLSSTLLPIARYPDFGLVDWFVEDAVGQADDTLRRNMVASSPLSNTSIGEIRVVPAWGIYYW